MKRYKIYISLYMLGALISNGAIYVTMVNECQKKDYICEDGRPEAFFASLVWPTYWSQEIWKWELHKGGR